MIICGDGVAASQAQAELVQIAEQLGAQVWNTVLFGAFNFPNTHPQYGGELPGEHAAIRRALARRTWCSPLAQSCLMRSSTLPMTLSQKGAP